MRISRLVLSPFLVSPLAGLVLAVACGGTTGSVGAAPSDAGSDSNGGGNNNDNDGAPANNGDDGSAPLDDGGVVVTEGGSNPNLDGGDDDDDDGGGDTLPDGGACNAIVDDGTAVTSTCASVEPILGGGALVAGTYHLAAVTTYGTVSFCKTGFIPVGFKETVDMTVTAGVGTADTVSQLAATKERRSSVTLTPGANNSSPLTEQTLCPITATTAPIKYDAVSNTTKTAFTLRLPYGKGEADYVFELE